MPLNRSKELTGGFMAIYIKGSQEEKEVGCLKRGETFLHEEEYYLVTADGPFSLTTGFGFDDKLSANVVVVHLNLTRVG